MPLAHNGSETSRAAAKDAAPKAPCDCERIHAFAIARGVAGITCDEAEVALNLSHQTCSARVHDMRFENPPRLVKAGRKRATRTGSKAEVLLAYGVSE